MRLLLLLLLLLLRNVRCVAVGWPVLAPRAGLDSGDVILQREEGTKIEQNASVAKSYSGRNFWLGTIYLHIHCTCHR
jgi:hypothetical protein